MNHIYKVIWNKNHQEWQAVSECAANNGKATKASSGTRQGANLSFKSLLFKSFLSKLAAGSLLIIALPAFALANNLPTGGQIQTGAGQINSSGQNMTINQTSQTMVVDWQSFSIGKDASVNFVQPNAQAAALNRVLGDQVSNIRGALNANGQVFLVNPNGILFSQTARVDVGSLVASTLNISNENFINGNYRFEGNSSNAVTNQGNIQTLNGGTVAFIAAKIINTGNITTPKGNTLMGAGNKVVLDLGGPVKIEVEVSELETYIEQGGAIKADGGTVYLTAKAANALTSSVINHTGITQAQTLASGEDGTIMLMGDMQSGTVQVAGTLDASAANKGNGGFVETSAAKVQINDVKVTTQAKQGKTGEWLIDPTDFTVSEGTAAQTANGIGATTLSSSLGTTSVTLETQATDTGAEKGDIHINGAVTWNAATTLTLKAHNDIYINKAITANNTAGKLALEYGQKAVADGNTADYYINAPVNLKAGQNFITKLGNNGTATNWIVVDASNMNSAMNADKTKSYVLGEDITLSGTNNWNPIGIDSANFTGEFDGLGHIISNLHIHDDSKGDIGLFGYTNGATIRNIGLVNVYAKGIFHIGGLVGYSIDSIIENSYAKGAVSGINFVGGLVGAIDSSTIKNSYASSTVGGTNKVGGLVGSNFMVIIKNSYANGAVSGNLNVGGLVGANNSSTITNSYASGSVNGQFKVGGLIGFNDYGTITNSFYDQEVNTAVMDDSTAYGRTKAQILSALTSKAGWTTTGGGGAVEGYELILLPYLTNVTKNEDKSTFTLFESGMGTSSNAYKITNWTQLQNINHANILTNNYYFSLLNNLDSTTAGYTDLASATANGAKGWNPIGNYLNMFRGVFDGAGKTISNLHINDTNKSYAGFFGHVNGSTIKNSYVSGTVSGYSYVGGLVGFNSYSTIENSYAVGTVSGSNSTVGGLVGYNNSSTIENSYAVGTVSGNSNVGGLVGSNRSSSTIINSYASGSVSGNNNTVGGLVGYNDSSTIENSYAVGTVSGNSNVGGLVGYNRYSSTITNSYASGTVSETNYVGGLIGDNDNGTVTNSFYDKEANTAAMGDSAKGRTKAEILSAFSNKTGWTTIGGGGAAVEGYELLLLPYLTNVTRDEDRLISTLFESGMGINGNAYTIKNWNQLQNINNSNILTNNYYFSLLNDLGSTTAGYTNTGLGWNPIGNKTNKFKGEFDGTGKIISNIFINRTSQDYIGLFGVTNDATIKNIGLVGVDIKGKNHVSGLIGENYFSTITNSYASGTVSGDLYVGGLVGFNNYSTIANSYSNGTVIGIERIGGLVGTNINSTITNSYASGDVSGNESVGGLVGYNIASTITKSFYNKTNNPTTAAISGVTGLSTKEFSYGQIFKTAGWDIVADSTVASSTPIITYDSVNSKYVWTIAPLDLSYTLSDKSKTYDGQTQSLSGLYTNVFGDDYSFITSGYKFKRNTSDVTSYKNAGTYDGIKIASTNGFLTIKTTGNTDGKYVINKKDITAISGITAENKTYDGNTKATLVTTAATFAGIIDNDALTVVTATGAFADKNAADGKTVSISNLALGGTDAENYNLASTTATTTANVAKKDITAISGITAENKTYDGNTKATLVTTAATFAGIIDNDALTVVTATGAFADKNAADGKTVSIANLALGGTDAENYNLASTTATAAANVAKKDITAISGITAENKTYDGNTKATLVTTAATFAGIVDNDALTVATATGVFADKNAADGKTVSISNLALGGDDVNNYNLASTTATTTANITKKDITAISGITAENKTYDGNTKATLVTAAATFAGIIDNDALTVTTATGAFTDKNAADGKTVSISNLALGGTDVNNYNLTSTTATAAANITKKDITAISGITAENKTYDGNTKATLVTTAATFTGIVDNDALTVATATSVFADKNAADGKTVSISNLALGGDDVNNYNLASTTATAAANITKKDITAISGITAENKTYDGNTKATLVTTAATFVGIIDNDALTVATATSVFADKNAADGKTVSISNLALGGTDAENYNLASTTATAAANITKKDITAISGITAENKTYDGNTKATLVTTAATFAGIIDNDALTVVTATGAFADKNAADGKTVSISNLALGGTDAENYNLASTTATAAANVAKKDITAISGITAENKTYDGNTKATLVTTAATFAGIIDNDALTVVTATGAFADKNAADGKTVSISNLALGGDDVNNYNLTSTTASTTANISAAPTPDPIEPPEPVIPEPVIPEPVIPEPVIPEPVIPEPVIPEPVIPEPVIPEPVVPEPVIPDPVAPAVNPAEKIIAEIKKQASNVFTPAPRWAKTPNAATSNPSQQSGNLELIEMNGADVNAMVNLGSSNSLLLPIFVLQGGINLGNFNENEQ